MEDGREHPTFTGYVNAEYFLILNLVHLIIIMCVLLHSVFTSTYNIQRPKTFTSKFVSKNSFIRDSFIHLKCSFTLFHTETATFNQSLNFIWQNGKMIAKEQELDGWRFLTLTQKLFAFFEIFWFQIIQFYQKGFPNENQPDRWTHSGDLLHIIQK